MERFTEICAHAQVRPLIAPVHRKTVPGRLIPPTWPNSCRVGHDGVERPLPSVPCDAAVVTDPHNGVDGNPFLRA